MHHYLTDPPLQYCCAPRYSKKRCSKSIPCQTVSNKHKSEKMIPLNFKCNDAEKRGRKLCNFGQTHRHTHRHTHTHINYSNKTSTVFRTDRFALWKSIAPSSIESFHLLCHSTPTTRTRGKITEMLTLTYCKTVSDPSTSQAICLFAKTL